MAVAPDPPSPAGAEASAWASSRITQEEAERLAETFRPSWELDDAVLRPEEAGGPVGAAFGGGTPADLRGPVQALNGTHAPAPAMILRDEVKSSVIIDLGPEPGVVASALDLPPERPRSPEPAPTRSATLVWPAAPPADAPKFSHFASSAATQARTEPTLPRRGAASFDVGRLDIVKRSRMLIWVALGAAAILLIAAGVWFASSRDQAAEKQSAPPVVPNAQALGESPANRIPPPPPPTETTVPTAAMPTTTSTATAGTTATITAGAAGSAAAAGPTAAAPPPRGIFAPPTPGPAPAAPTPPASPPLGTAGQATAPPAMRAAVPQAAPRPPPPVWTPPSAPAKPPIHPKGGSTIVRDVPF